MSEDLPEIIYHYTTQDGLLGILKESALWVTKIHYLNDASELIEPLHVADTVLTKLKQQLDIEDVKDKQTKREIYLSMLDDIRDWERINICVASFCADGDFLSQWRGYGVPGSSYSIGFDREKLTETIQSHPFDLHRCQYFNPEAYRQRIEQFIIGFINEVTEKHSVPIDFISEFVKMAATIKFECFEEEFEWRIVSRRPLRFSDDRFNFRAGKYMLIPYYSLPLNLSSIVEIIVGPCHHPDLARDAVYGLANKYELKKVLPGNVKLSSIPYRVF